MKIICPNCQAEILKEQANVVTDLAQCPKCSNIRQLSLLLKNKISTSPLEKELGDPPANVKIT